jgi:hypothetical protein
LRISTGLELEQRQAVVEAEIQRLRAVVEDLQRARERRS